jgi:dienelactone hydrolase
MNIYMTNTKSTNMKKHYLNIICLCLMIISFAACSPSQTKTGNTEQQNNSISETISFPSLDGLPITANLYLADEKFPFIILCHQAGYNKSEYAETALKLNKNGFNCLAIDQRSGGKVDDTENETYKLAVQKKLRTTYLDAEPDIIAAVNYVAEKYKQPVVLLGSSYSASLALKVGTENDKVKAIIAFSPGEYFGEKLNLTSCIKELKKPVFVTSSKEEAPDVASIMKGVTSEIKIQFIPKEEGVHGASALMEKTPNNKEYWDALLEFLNKIK